MIIVWLLQAIEDRDAQLDYVADDSPQAALDLGDRIEEHISALADFPRMGRSGRKSGTRELVIQGTPYIAIYRVKMRLGRVEILRLLHGTQQWP
ncbi:MAG: type II toxin-antitoxin system RelE/ParE family toxin [Asticcacaulis sp.]